MGSVGEGRGPGPGGPLLAELLSPSPAGAWAGRPHRTTPQLPALLPETWAFLPCLTSAGPSQLCIAVNNLSVSEGIITVH